MAKKTKTVSAPKTIKGKGKGAKPVANETAKGKGKGKGKTAPPVILHRVARRADNGKPLEMIGMGAYGGRAARTSAIENAIAKAGAKGLTMADLKIKSNVLACEMHVRNLCANDGRPHFGGRAPVARKICPQTGKLLYVDAKYVKKGQTGVLPSYNVNGGNKGK